MTGVGKNPMSAGAFILGDAEAKPTHPDSRWGGTVDGDAEYLRKRLDEERRRAQREGDPAVVKAHRVMADAYEARLSAMKEGQTAPLVKGSP